MDATTKNGGIPDLNGEDYDGEEEEDAGSCDDSDVSPTPSVSRTSAYWRAIPAGRNHHGAH